MSCRACRKIHGLPMQPRATLTACTPVPCSMAKMSATVHASPEPMITLSDVMISTFQGGGHGGDGTVQEQFSLNFAKIEFEYKPQDAKGGLEGSVFGKWDLKANKVP